jgi:hypothetical protein
MFVISFIHIIIDRHIASFEVCCTLDDPKNKAAQMGYIIFAKSSSQDMSHVAGWCKFRYISSLHFLFLSLGKIFI